MARRPEILRTDSVVLHAMKYGETSSILNLLTRDRGLVGVIVKGARTSSNRFGSTLEPMAVIQAVIHVKPSRSLQLLTETSHLQTFPTLRGDLDRIRIGLRIVELTRAVAQEEQASESLFSLVTGGLAALDACEDRAENLWPFFQLRLARVLGFEPSFDRDELAGLEAESAVIDLDTGWISHAGQGAAGTGAGMRVSRSALRAFGVFARADVSDVLRMNVQPAVLREVESVAAAYMKYHIEESWPSRSERVFAQFDAG